MSSCSWLSLFLVALSGQRPPVPLLMYFVNSYTVGTQVNLHIIWGLLRQCPPEPWQVLIVTALATLMAVLPIPQCIVGVPFNFWCVVWCNVAIEVVSYTVRCERFSAQVFSTGTVKLPGDVLPLSSCIAPDVIAATWCSMCDRHATHVLIFNGVATFCTIVEAYWCIKQVPHCSATDVVVPHPMHWKDNRVTT